MAKFKCHIMSELKDILYRTLNDPNNLHTQNNFLHRATLWYQENNWQIPNCCYILLYLIPYNWEVVNCTIVVFVVLTACDDSPCEHGGRCAVDFLDHKQFYCNCANTSYKGDRCHISEYEEINVYFTAKAVSKLN